MARTAARQAAVLAMVGASLTGAAAIALVLLNAGAWLALERARPDVAELGTLRPEVIASVREVYAGRTEDEVRVLLEETWLRPYTYDPWTGFRERPRRGTFVNIDPAGFRRAPDGVGLDHPGTRVFFFGGSTTFGYGVADGETIPARLEERLRARYPERDVRVFNFGRGHYFSGQELALLTRLLAEGQRPDLAIFLDGCNEGQDRPFFADEMAQHFEARQGPEEEPSWLASLPLARLLARREAAGPDPELRPYYALDPDELALRWSANRELIRALARGFGFEARIFLQPIAGYRNAHLAHRFQTRWYIDNFDGARAKIESLEPLADGADTISATHLLDGYAAQAFVDSLHYTPEVCDLLAGFIAERLEL